MEQSREYSKSQRKDMLQNNSAEESGGNQELRSQEEIGFILLSSRSLLWLCIRTDREFDD